MNDIDRLKQLLFGNEKKALDAITRRLETPESRTDDISDVLPEAILRSHAADPRLTRALEEPVELCIKSSIRRDPGDFADALFPVIGPAIRKAIAEALRSMTQSLNQAIENSFSVTTRFKAWRAGVPLGDYILQRNLVYRVEQAFLIKREDGLLIEHVHHEGALSRDSDAVSAMFTAIQDFIQDSFKQDGGESLTKAELGELSLWGVHGPKASLVCVVRGVAPAGLRTELSEILERIHLGYSEALADYNGSPDGVAGIELELEKCLLLEHREVDDSEGKKKPIAGYIMLFIVVALLAWWIGSSYADSRRVAKYRDALESTPGIVVHDITRRRGQVHVRGLRDPLSGDPVEIAPAADIDPADLRLDFAPYQSLDAPIIERRARRILQPPRGVGISLDGSRLRLTGSASAEWKQKARLIGQAIPGVATLDFSSMTVDDEQVLREAIALLQPPSSVELSVINGRLEGRGSAPAGWLRRATNQAGTLAGVNEVVLDEIVMTETLELQQLLQAIDGTSILFAANLQLASGQAAELERLGQDLLRLQNLADGLGLQAQIVVTGSTDGIGNVSGNQLAAQGRADLVSRALIGAGVDPALIQLRTSVSPIDGRADPARRRAIIRAGIVRN
ncbi:MAG: hypothetical protein HKN49_13520 [Gammaproteobacteria bacterium]|nr:hypothetical protein [Gammaproteobacteria bacterium]